MTFRPCSQDEAPPKSHNSTPVVQPLPALGSITESVSLRPQIRYPVTESQSRGPCRIRCCQRSQPAASTLAIISISFPIPMVWKEPTPSGWAGKALDGHVDNSVDKFHVRIGAAGTRRLTLNSYRTIS